VTGATGPTGSSGLFVIVIVVATHDPIGDDSTRYLVPGSGRQEASPEDAGTPLAVGGTIGNLHVRQTTMGTDPATFTLYKNGSPTTVACTMNSTETSCSNGTDEVDVAAGDLVTLEVDAGDLSDPHIHASFSITGSN